MKYLIFITTCIFCLSACQQATEDFSASVSNEAFVSTDIDNFWKAYDKITATTDSATQYQLLQELFLDKGTPGLEAIIEARRYSPRAYINAINNYPKFWNSIRPNTLRAPDLIEEMKKGVGKLKNIYPDIKPAKIYFTMGVFRTPGTTVDSLILIGSELAMGHDTVNTSELPKNLDYVKQYFKENPIENIAFLNIHEYVHTQQTTTIGDNLLTQTLYEGTAEFIAELAMQQPSPSPAIQFGKENAAIIKDRFAQEMFSHSYHNWLWNDLENDFKVRDLGYYVGYAMAQKYYDAAEDKQLAIKELIEVNYPDSTELEAFVDKTGYFSKPVAELKTAYDQNRPVVVNVKEFKNGAENVDPKIQQVSVEFSKPMDKRFRGFDYGPLGRNNVLTVHNFEGYTDDGKFVIFEVQMEPNKHYQMLLTERFMDENGLPLKPYLIDIKTSK